VPPPKNSCSVILELAVISVDKLVSAVAKDVRPADVASAANDVA